MSGCRLHKEVVARSSLLLLRSFLLSLFAGVDVALRDDQLYCDVLCEQGPVIVNEQVSANVFMQLCVCYSVCIYVCNVSFVSTGCMYHEYDLRTGD